jgi:hypothetical protein
MTAFPRDLMSFTVHCKLDIPLKIATQETRCKGKSGEIALDIHKKRLLQSSINNTIDTGSASQTEEQIKAHLKVLVAYFDINLN